METKQTPACKPNAELEDEKMREEKKEGKARAPAFLQANRGGGAAEADSRLRYPHAGTTHRLYSAPRNKFSGFLHTLHSAEARRESERTCDECRHFKRLRMSSAERRAVSHLRWSMSDRPDKTSKFLSGQTLFYTKHIRAVKRTERTAELLH